MIKPSLARGLQLVGATTTEEYKKTIEKDGALERRFQGVRVDEPSVESTISILRGLKPRYEVGSFLFLSFRFFGLSDFWSRSIMELKFPIKLLSQVHPLPAPSPIPY